MYKYLKNLKKAYAIRSKPKAILYGCVKFKGSCFQKIIIKPNVK